MEVAVPEVSTAAPSVLLLDDDAELANVYRIALEERGFSVSIASNGAIGLQQVVARDFDVILCDIVMPHLPGNMFYLAVRKAKPYLCDRFLFITGHRHDSESGHFLQHVDALVLYKPVRIDDLVGSISLVLARSKNRCDFRLRIG